ncbi:restriction endonuclease subunit S [Pasteurella multocida subsp. multocida]|nr:restriction endonuclease subunit S [Pasteurella multocida subsp. multocida]
MGNLFEIENTLSFNKDMLVSGTEYDYVTRTSQNQGVLQTTGFVNKENINCAGNWSLGLLQMDFFYRERPWYAGQFVRKVTPKIEIKDKRAIIFFSTLLNKQKSKLLSVLVRNVDEVFKNTKISLPTKNGKIDFDFMENFISQLEAFRLSQLEAYLLATGLKDYTLNPEENQVVMDFEGGKVQWGEFKFEDIFDTIKQGRRLKKEDQIEGDIPFVMAGITNTGVVNYISNPVASFPKNSITIDIFGNAFYRNYDFGAGDDTGVYWNTQKILPKEAMLFLTKASEKALEGKFSYGKKLRSSQSLKFKMALPTKNNTPDYNYMALLISAIQKLVIKDVVLYADRKIAATKHIIESNNTKR